MIAGLLQIFLFQGLGELIAQATHTTVPGPVIGLVCLFTYLQMRGSVPADMQNVSDGLTRYFGILFVPASVGIVLYLPLLAEHGLAIVAVLAASVLLTMVATILFLKGYARWRGL